MDRQPSSSPSDAQIQTATIEPAGTSANTSLEELKAFAAEQSFETESTSRYMSRLGVDIDSSQALEERVSAFQRQQENQVEQYMAEANQRNTKSDHCLTILNGWDQKTSHTTTLQQLIQSQAARATTGGLYLRWNGTGIAINPGKNFLENFHDQGHHVNDIDCVVVTRDDASSYCETEAIYALNYRLNSNRGDDRLHIIHYYLNPQAHRNISARLKPNFKQERNTVHCLELFVDSPDVEKIDLSSTVTLHYFHASNNDSCTNLGIRIDGKMEDGCTSTSVGYISGASWSPTLGSKLGRCDILVTGVGNTNPADYGKVKYSQESLGYFGSYSLMEETAPRLLICSEFGGREGDIRVEMAKKMRQEYAYSNQHATTILPADSGLNIDLQSLQVNCSVTGRPTDPSQICVVKTKDAFGKLQYLSPNCFV